jgi:hypothetical protein
MNAASAETSLASKVANIVRMWSLGVMTCGSQVIRSGAWAYFTRCRSRRDLSEFEQFEAERFDLRKDAEHSGAVLEQAGEHGLAALHLGHHRGKGGQAGSSEPAPYPDRVQAWRCGHAIILQPDLVSRLRRNLVIVRMPVLALSRRCERPPG